MFTTLKPSSPDSHNESFEPNTEPAAFPTVQQILDTHYPKYAREPHLYDALIKPNHTTKASLISDAVAKRYIKHEDHPYLLCVLVEPLPDHVRLEGGNRYLPVVMCIDEGGYGDFSKELMRLFGQVSEKTVVIEMEFTDGYSKIVASEVGWEYSARVLLEDKAKAAVIRVMFNSP